jgi:hypothetical protein
MKRGLFILVLSLAVFSCSSANADIVAVNMADDGDGAFVCEPWMWFGMAPDVTMDVYGNQYSSPGHLLGNITTGSPLDPTLKISNSIDNDTTNMGAWAAFQVNIYMSTPFTVTNVTVMNPANDWTVVSYNAAGSYTGSNYVAQIVYDTGTPVPVGGTLDFGYSLQFAGATHYELCQEFIPTAVPEPSSIALVALGSLLMTTASMVRGRSKRPLFA